MRDTSHVFNAWVAQGSTTSNSLQKQETNMSFDSPISKYISDLNHIETPTGKIQKYTTENKQEGSFDAHE